MHFALQNEAYCNLNIVLMELFDITAPEEIDSLQQKLTVSYPLLDPMLPDEGKFMARWRLRLNVTPDEIKTILEM
jgi:predicted transcriptional regulator of viral defense system